MCEVKGNENNFVTPYKTSVKVSVQSTSKYFKKCKIAVVLRRSSFDTKLTSDFKFSNYFEAADPKH